MSQIEPNKTNQKYFLNKQKNCRRQISSIAILGFILLSTTGCFITNKIEDEREIKTAKLEQVSPTEEQKLSELARSITVKIISDSNGGSGVLIKKEGNIYTVLTNNHVTQDDVPSEIITPDDKTYQAKLLDIDFQEKDLALLQFESKENYQIASLNNLANTDTGNQVFAAGFPFRDNDTRNRDFSLKQGRISLVLPQPFRGGYQVGYLNDIEKGMSGGPVLNSAGKVIAINGIHSHPLWGNPYIYEDDTSPSDILRKRLERSSWGVPVETLAQFASDIIPELSVARSEGNDISTTELTDKIDRIAQQIAVKIQWKDSNGSGTIIARDGNTYSVLTAEHVVSGDDRIFTIYAPDGKKYPVDRSKTKIWDNVDLAVIQFTSEEDYQVATLANYSLDSQDEVVFVTGWPNRLRSNDLRGRKFSVGFSLPEGGSGNATLDHRSLSEGQELIYTNLTEKGMSGGAVLDASGRLIGVHTAIESVEGDRPSPILQKGQDERQLDIGYSLGVPIRTFLGLMKNDNSQLNWQIETSPPSQLTPPQKDSIVSQSLVLTKPDDSADEVDWLNYGNKLWRALRFEQAQQAFEKSIDLNPSFFEAWYGHGLALKSQGELEKAVSSFQKVVESRPPNNVGNISRWYNFAFYANRQKAIAFAQLLQLQKSLEALNQAIAMRPDDFTLYYNQAETLALLGKYGEALNAIDKSIRFSEEQNPYPYLKKAEVMNSLLIFDTNRIIENYTKAIQIQPSLALAHALRGVSSNSNYAGAIQDINKAIELNPDNALFYAQRGLIYAKVGNQQQVEQNFERAIKLEPDNPAIYSLRGQARANSLVASKNKGEQVNAENIPQAIIDDYIEAIRIAPESAGDLYISLTSTLSTVGDYQKSVSFYNKAEQHLSNDNLAFFLAYQGLGHYLSGDEAKATESFTEARELEPDNASIELWQYLAYYNKMNEYYQAGNREKGDEELNKAIDLVNQAIKKYPQLAFRFYENNAITYFTREFSKPEGVTRDYSSQTESLTNAINSSNVDNAYQYSQRSGAYRSQGNYQLALADMNRAIELEPEANPHYYNARGNVYNDLKEYQKAIDDYTKAIEIAPDNPQYYENRFHSRYNLRDYDRVFGGLQKYLSSLTNNLDEESAPLFIDLNQSERLKALNNTILYPDNVEYRTQLAQQYQNLAQTYTYYTRDYQSAFASLEQLAAVYPEDPILSDTYRLIGEFALVNQDWEEGLIAFDKIAEIDPNSPLLFEIYSNLTAIAIQQENESYVTQGLNRLERLPIDNSEGYNILGSLYFRQNEYDKAIDFYTKAIELEPNEVLYYDNRASVYEAIGNNELYRKDMQKRRKLTSRIRSRFYLSELQMLP